jgi:hypothetical protein
MSAHDEARVRLLDGDQMERTVALRDESSPKGPRAPGG